MRNLTVSIDDDLYETAKSEAAKRQKSVSALVRELLTELNSHSIESNAAVITALEKKHNLGYARKPVMVGEFDIPECDRVWGDE